MEFLSWHYTKGIGVYLTKWQNILENTVSYFSLPVLLRTLFSPWKRLATKRKGSGFSWDDFKYELSFNVTSRIVGSFVRASLILTAILTLTVIVFLGIFGFFVYLLVPLLSLPSYSVYQKRLDQFVSDLVSKTFGSPNALYEIFSNEAGEFVLNHIGTTKEIFLQNAAGHISLDPRKTYTGYADILAHIIESGIFPPEFWRSVNITPDDMLIAGAMWDEKRRLSSNEVTSSNIGKVKGVGVNLLFGYTPILDAIGTELRLEKGADILRGREDLINRIKRILDAKGSLILTGQPGVGKKTLLIDLAKQLDDDYKRLIEASVVKLTKGIVDKNERKNALQAMFSESSAAGNVILVIKDLPRLTNIEFEGNDFTDIFEEQLEKRKIQIIAVTTSDEYEKFIARNTKLMKYFERVDMEPLNIQSAMQVLIDKSAKLELENAITIPIPILRKMITTADNFANDTPFPKKALELLDASVTFAKQNGASAVTYDDVARAASEKSGIPIMALTQSHKQKLSNLENIMSEKLIGQGTAIELIAQSLRSRTTGVSSIQKPIGTFLFLGPTGVGKTETAKVLSHVYFGHTDILRFDMAEFIGIEGITKLIGSMHFNQPGVLTTAIKNKPAGMILLDELEKASNEVFNSLLTLFDEGYIVDAFGKKIDGRNTFIISTSNAGSEIIREMVMKGIKGEELQKQVLEHILQERIFSPEFINRFDGVVVYEPLTKEHLYHIAVLKLNELKQRMLEKNILLEFHEHMPYKVAEDGYDPLFGARPMNRVIQMVIGDVISRAILSEEIRPGDKLMLLPGQENRQYHWKKIG